MSRAQVVSIGALYLDVVCHEFPFGDALWPDRQVVGADYDFLPGGSAVNFACTSAGLGLLTTLVGKTGTDGPADVLHSLLVDHGVDLRTTASETVKTNISINFNGPAGNSLHATVGTANQSMTADEVIPTVAGLLDQSRYLYLGGCLKLTGLLPDLPELARIARSKNVVVVVDHGRVFGKVSESNRRLVRELCQEADIYLPSVNELLVLWSARSIEGAAQEVRKRCSATLVVKNGGDGVTAFTENEPLHADAYPVEVDNPVGAGDGFNAGFIRAHSEGRNLSECLDFGCATAALKISRREFPTSDAVNSLRKTRKLIH